MNRFSSLAATFLSLALLLPGGEAQSAATQATPGIPGTRQGPPDCALARDPGRCEALRTARETCKDKRGTDRQACLQAQDIHVDCGKARHPKRCEAREQAREACKGKKGPERRQCLRDAGAPQPPRQ